MNWHRAPDATNKELLEESTSGQRHVSRQDVRRDNGASENTRHKHGQASAKESADIANCAATDQSTDLAYNRDDCGLSRIHPNLILQEGRIEVLATMGT